MSQNKHSSSLNHETRYRPVDNGIFVVKRNLRFGRQAFLARAECSKTMHKTGIREIAYRFQVEISKLYFSAVFGTLSAYSSIMALTNKGLNLRQQEYSKNYF